MTHESVPPHDGPAELLSTVRDLTRTVRTAQRGTWLALLILAVIPLLAIPLYRYAPHHLQSCRSGPAGAQVCATFIPVVLAYWPVALMIAYGLVAALYVHRSRQRGLGTRVRQYVVAGVILAVVAAAATTWRALHPAAPVFGLHAPGVSPHLVVYSLATPLVTIGLALLALAWAERSVALLGFSIVYVVIVLVQSAQTVHSRSAWAFLPELLVPALVLLAGAVGFALIQLVASRSAR